jgi:translation initiation factor IF-2
MSVKLSKVTKDLNVGLATVVEYLHKQGFSEVAENNPNARISDEQYEMLLSAFSKDKSVKKESEIAAQRHKERPKNESVVLDSYAKKVAEAEVEQTSSKEPAIKFKTVGKIDLDALNKKKAAEPAPEPEPEPQPEPEPIAAPQEEVAEVSVPQQEEPAVVETAPVEEQPKTVSDESTKKTSEEVFTYGNKNIQSSINVVGKIDLSQLNQQTRPKKKTKEETKSSRADEISKIDIFDGDDSL